MNLKGKTVIITGATGGIGSEITRYLDREGSNLILISKNEKKLEDLNNSLINKHKTYALDFSSQESVISFLNNFNDKFNVYINSTGIGIYKQIEDISIDDWNSTFNIGLTSNYLFTKELISKRLYIDDSLFLNIGSGAGVIPMSERSLYCASKFALRGFTLSLSEEFARVANPKFCLITLGSTLTDFGPLGIEKNVKRWRVEKLTLPLNGLRKKLSAL